MTRMISYIRVSTVEQAEGGYSLQQQHMRILQACETDRWELVREFEDRGLTAGNLDRPALMEALRMIARGEADGLVVAKLDRLARSAVDFGRLLEWFDSSQARLVALDMNVDTATPAGRLVAQVLAAVAEWELSTIRERTKAGLRAARAEGRPISGPSIQDSPRLLQRVRELREDGASYQQICDVFNEEGVPTVRGGVMWRPSSLQSILGRRSAPKRRAVQLPELTTRKTPAPPVKSEAE